MCSNEVQIYTHLIQLNSDTAMTALLGKLLFRLKVVGLLQVPPVQSPVQRLVDSRVIRAATDSTHST